MEQATLLTRLIEAGNPNDLTPCPNDQSVPYHNCWGTYIAVTGDKYVGEFKDGKIHGQGTYYFLANNQFKGGKYVGEIKDYKHFGQGTYTWANGDKHVGEWKDDEPNGQGMRTLANGDKFVGEYKNGAAHGQGTYTWANGQKSVGEYKDSTRNGKGIMYRPDGSVEESGIYQNDRLIKSEYVDPDSFTRIAK